MKNEDARFVDVLLPLAVPGVFTYVLPTELADRAQWGRRVVVPLGKRKRYTGIVVRRLGEAPEGLSALKAVEQVLDEAPLLLPEQYELWRWMAFYYLCTLGEVMKAALPAGLKLESVTQLELAADYDGPPPTDKTEAGIVRLLSDGRAMDIDALASRLGEAGIVAAAQRLVDCGAVRVHESLLRRFKPRTERRLRLTEAFTDEAKLHAALDAMRSAPAQRALLCAYIEAAEPAAALRLKNRALLREVTVAQLARLTPGATTALAALRRKGIVETYAAETSRLRSHHAVPGMKPKELGPQQQAALELVVECFKQKEVCLLHGVTGSGKTEVYMQLILRELAAGRQVLYLVPEIALTTQLTERLGRVLGGQMGVYHSRFPDAERVEMWLRQLSERAYPVVLGVRSSLLLPWRRLGLIIVDEEHEPSYKQQDPAPRYHARDAAIVLARQVGAKVLLGSATPAVETYHNATATGKYGLVEMKERFGGAVLPQVVVEDVKELRRKKLMPTPLSPRLIDAVREALERGEQAILFKNRRGYAPVLECAACGWAPRCAHCDVTLTVHRQQGRLVCHYCGASYPIPAVCPNCQTPTLREAGYGTERIEAAVQELFPEARTARLDLDTTRSQSAYGRILDDFQQGRTDILIGTQMVTKGLDFDRVSVVGILDADQMLSLPDFRAYERAFDMMTQVAGRAGRRQRRGLVVLQTRQPQLALIGQVVRGDYEAMYRSQEADRRHYGFPPAVRLVAVYLKHRDEAVCEHAAQALAALLRPYLGEGLLGPERPPVARAFSQHIRKLLVKLPPTHSPTEARRLLLAAQQRVVATPAYRGVTLFYDVDPL